ncbi:hypothetical protein B0H16DRAFT_1473015 [Mycena metata]|uniref:Uncharacterized protein n=1 Tax=Mycena metata TaxID=1033252 RepID=A0AAD7HME7_9AGAR|nr:hypothetical protein B0H16DRAFT_1473015 [Mycena metata]
MTVEAETSRNIEIKNSIGTKQGQSCQIKPLVLRYILVLLMVWYMCSLLSYLLDMKSSTAWFMCCSSRISRAFLQIFGRKRTPPSITVLDPQFKGDLSTLPGPGAALPVVQILWYW